MSKNFIDCGGHTGQSVLKFKKSKEYDTSFKIYSFEPLCNLAKKYKDWKDIIFIDSAVWICDGKIDLYVDERAFSKTQGYLGQGSSLFRDKKTGNLNKEHPIKVKCIDFGQWILKTFDKDDYIILKMNIEGSEYKVLNKMLKDDAIDYINKAYISFHYKKIGLDEKIHNNLIKKLKLLPNLELEQI